jgi:hypothetical protein
MAQAYHCLKAASEPSNGLDRADSLLTTTIFGQGSFGKLFSALFATSAYER